TRIVAAIREHQQALVGLGEPFHAGEREDGREREDLSLGHQRRRLLEVRERPPGIPGVERLAAGVPLSDGAKDRPPATLSWAFSIRQLERIAREHPLDAVEQPRASEI